VDEYAGVPIRPDAWDEPTVRDSVAAGADLTLFSGDKLLGGPQAGVIVGARAAVERLRNDPLARALRPDKLTLAALEATLRLYRDPDALRRRLPVARMLSEPVNEIERRAGQLAGALRACEPRGGAAIASAAARERRPANESAVGGLGTMDVCVAPDESFAGGGAAPTLALPTWTVRLRVAGVGAATLAASLRRRDLPVVCRIKDEALIFDCRTIAAGEVELIAAALAEALRDVVE
jgi:L-seryl-tRNA(Ser) seleniumtransferase